MGGRDLSVKMPVVFILLAAALVACVHSPPPFDEAEWQRDAESRDTALLYAPHHEEGRFFNPWMPVDRGGLLPFLRWRFSRKEPFSEEEQAFAPVVAPGLKGRIESLGGSDFIAWIGHGSFLLGIGGELYVTDPMFSDRALLPRRKVPPAITAQQIGALGRRVTVIVSHNHYDHFDKASVRDLPPDSRVFVPLGLKSSVEALGKREVREMDWWEEADLGNGVRLICLPAQHWSRRISQGRNRTLWASFLLLTPTVNVYYGGDSGYFVGYREIGRRFPGIDYALMPVTAYRPRWFMHYAHVDVDEALRAFNELGANRFVPTQWGTFALGDEPAGFGALELRRAMEKGKVDPSRVLFLDIGGIHIIPADSSQARGRR